MVTIAIAGGTSPTLGRSITTAILQTTPNKPVLLTRLAPNAPKTKHGAEVHQVDYTSHSSLVNALQGVHTVISVLKIPGPEAATYQINLLKAAKAAGVKRFAPAQFENGPLADGRVDIVALKSVVWKECAESGLECTRFCNGMFMNYLALGKVFHDDKEREVEVTQNLVDLPIIWDIAAGVVEMPVKDNGTAPLITLTDIRDVGNFVAAACMLPDGQWRSSMEMVGETLNADDITKMIEQASGKVFERRPINREALEKRVQSIEGIGKNREEIVAKLVSQIEIMMLEEQEGMTIMRPVLNELCPEVRPMGVRQFLDRCWRQ